MAYFANIEIHDDGLNKVFKVSNKPLNKAIAELMHFTKNKCSNNDGGNLLQSAIKEVNKIDKFFEKAFRWNDGSRR